MIRYLLLILLFASPLLGDTVGQESPGASLISGSYITSLSPYEAGRQQAAINLSEIMDIGAGLNDVTDHDIFYSDEFKYGGRWDNVVYYWNVPTIDKRSDIIPEPSVLLFMSMGVLFLRHSKHPHRSHC